MKSGGSGGPSTTQNKPRASALWEAMERTSLSRAQVNLGSPGSSGRRQAQSGAISLRSARPSPSAPTPGPHLVDGLQPQPVLPRSTSPHATESDLAHRQSPHAVRTQAVPGHRRHHLARRWARDRCLQTTGRRGQPAPWGLVPQGSKRGNRDWQKRTGWTLSSSPPQTLHTPLASKRTHGIMKPLGGVKVHTPKKHSQENRAGGQVRIIEKGSSFFQDNLVSEEPF